MIRKKYNGRGTGAEIKNEKNCVTMGEQLFSFVVVGLGDRRRGFTNS